MDRFEEAVEQELDPIYGNTPIYSTKDCQYDSRIERNIISTEEFFAIEGDFGQYDDEYVVEHTGEDDYLNRIVDKENKKIVGYDRWYSNTNNFNKAFKFMGQMLRSKKEINYNQMVYKIKKVIKDRQELDIITNWGINRKNVNNDYVSSSGALQVANLYMRRDEYYLNNGITTKVSELVSRGNKKSSNTKAYWAIKDLEAQIKKYAGDTFVCDCSAGVETNNVLRRALPKFYQDYLDDKLTKLIEKHDRLERMYHNRLHSNHFNNTRKEQSNKCYKNRNVLHSISTQNNDVEVIKSVSYYTKRITVKPAALINKTMFNRLTGLR